MDSFTVYAHVFPNNKVYVGITKQTTEARWKNGKGYGKSQPLIRKAINKYGWNNVRHVILFNSLTKEEACRIEQHYIHDLRLYDTENGYNTCLGGEANSPCEQVREKIAKSTKEMWANDDYRSRTIAAMTGKKRTEKARKNISKAQKKRFENPKERYKAGSATRGKHRSEQAKADTSQSLKRYYSDPFNAEKHRKEMQIRNQTHCKQIRCVETQRVYKSAQEASSELGMCHQNLSACLHGKRKTFGGYHWEFI